MQLEAFFTISKVSKESLAEAVKKHKNSFADFFHFKMKEKLYNQ